MQKLFALTFLIAPLMGFGIDKIPNPTFSVEGQFHISGEAEAEILEVLKAEVFLISSAKESCKVTAPEVTQNLESILSDQSLMQSLSEFYPEIPKNIFSKLRILVSDFNEKKKMFRSFYIRKGELGPATIALDCSPGSRRLWKSLIAHELVHHINSNRSLAPWVDEMLAQNAEYRVSKSVNFERINSASGLKIFPSFLSETHLTEAHQYSSNFFFSQYILGLIPRSGFWPILSRNIKSIDDFSNALKNWIANDSGSEWLSDQLAPDALMRNFALALSINSLLKNKSSLYKVNFWNGFSEKSLITSPTKLALEPGSFARLDLRWQKWIAAQSDLTSYLVLKNGSQFRILDTTSDFDTNAWPEKFILLVNNSPDSIVYLDLH